MTFGKKVETGCHHGGGIGFEDSSLAHQQVEVTLPGGVEAVALGASQPVAAQRQAVPADGAQEGTGGVGEHATILGAAAAADSRLPAAGAGSPVQARRELFHRPCASR
ncbi:hypothetical protein D9M72_426680 [compost metagenome]